MRFANRWTIGEWTFYQVEDHWSTTEGQPLFAYAVTRKREDGTDEPEAMDHRGLPKVGELHPSLDRAIIAAISEKYTGARGASGTAVGTAADWFARMIGMDELVAVDYQAHRKVLMEVLAATAEHNGPTWRRARAVADELEVRGLSLATRVHP